MGANKLTVALLGIILVSLCVLNPVRAHANDLVLKADAEGLHIEPAQPGKENSFFQIEQMTPGDSESAAMTVINTENYAFTLSVEVKDLLEESSPALIDALRVEVSESGVVLADFPAKHGSYSFPEKIMPGSERTLVFKVELPCEAGNEYQRRKASLQWVFTAQADQSPTTPGGGGSGSKSASRASSGTTNIDTWTTLTEGETPTGLIATEEATPLAQPPDMPKAGGTPLWTVLLGVGFLLIGAGLFQNRDKSYKK